MPQDATRQNLDQGTPFFLSIDYRGVTFPHLLRTLANRILVLSFRPSTALEA